MGNGVNSNARGWVGPGLNGSGSLVGMGNVILAVDHSEINGPDQTKSKLRCLDVPEVGWSGPGQAHVLGLIWASDFENGSRPNSISSQFLHSFLLYIFFILKQKPN